MDKAVEIGSKWVRFNHGGDRVFTVQMIEGGTVYLGNGRGSTSSIPVSNFRLVWVEYRGKAL